MYREKNYSPLEEISDSLMHPVKQIPSKYFYDKKGSHLFDEICRLDEYYVTRTELKIMRDNITEITDQISIESILVELGSGSGIKTKLLLRHLGNIPAYIPVDISSEYLFQSADKLRNEFPTLPVYPLPADFTKPFTIPEIKEYYTGTTVYFPGSTLGNLLPDEARNLMGHISNLCGENGTFIIGVDLIKNKNTIEKAYNDSKGVTALFNLNILSSVNNETGADFNPDNFKHVSFFNEKESRIEMHLESLKNQVVSLNGYKLNIAEGERILTEYSYKYSLEMFAGIIRDSFRVCRCWTDKEKMFGIFLLKK